MIPLDEALGQLMWLSFAKKSRMLSEVELFNQASRGPWGAMVLIWKRRGMGITSLGCILMIVAVGLGFTRKFYSCSLEEYC